MYLRMQFELFSSPQTKNQALGEKEIRKITKNKRIPVSLFSFSSLRRFFLRESVHIKGN